MFFNSCPNNRRHKDSWEFLWRHSVNKSAQSQKKQAGKWPWSSSPPVKGRARTPFAGSLFPPLLSSMSFYQDFVSTGKVRSSRLGSKWTFSRSGLSSLLRVPHNLLVSLFFSPLTCEQELWETWSPPVGAVTPSWPSVGSPSFSPLRTVASDLLILIPAASHSAANPETNGPGKGIFLLLAISLLPLLYFLQANPPSASCLHQHLCPLNGQCNIFKQTCQ